MKTFKLTAAQGEVYATRLDALPEGCGTPVAPENGFLIVSHSEQGHHHGFCDDGAVTLMERPSNRPGGLSILYAIVKRPSEFRQDAAVPHKTVLFEPGIYELRKRREYDPIMEQARQVAD